MPTGENALPLAEAVGRGFKTLRVSAGATLNDVAKHARGIGLRWTASKVSDFEAGRSTPSFATVIAAAQALTMATGRAVSVSDLIDQTGPVAVTESLELDGAALAGALCGGGEEARVQEQRDAAIRRTERAAQILDGTAERTAESIREAMANTGTSVTEMVEAMRATTLTPPSTALLVQLRSGLDEQRLAKRLDVPMDQLARVSARLWGRPFSDERDRIAGPGANAQKRGQVSRALQEQIRAELGSTDGDD